MVESWPIGENKVSLLTSSDNDWKSLSVGVDLSSDIYTFIDAIV